MIPPRPRPRVAVHSENPLVWISGIRHALRQAGAGRGEIEAFSRAALAHSEPERIRRICADWADLVIRSGEPESDQASRSGQ